MLRRSKVESVEPWGNPGFKGSKTFSLGCRNP